MTTTVPQPWQPTPAHSWRPTPQHDLLLKAILAPEATAIAALHTWAETSEIEQLDEGSYWLLPRLYQRWQALNLDTSANPSSTLPHLYQRIKGVYRHVWSRNQLILRYIAEAVTGLQRAGITPVVVGGAALVAAPGADGGCRRADDSGLWVAPGDLEGALAILQGLGWHLSIRRSAHQLQAQQTAVGLRRQRDTLTLCWRVLPECPALGVAGEPTREGMVITLGNVQALALDPSDQCFVCCIHATRWQSRSPVYWLGDGAAVMEQFSVDWDRCHHLACQHHLRLPLRESLTYLTQYLGHSAMEPTRKILESTAISTFERAEFAAKGQAPKLWGQMPQQWFNYRRLHPHPWFQRPWGFAQFLTRCWGLQSPWQLPLHGSKQGLKRLLAIVGCGRSRGHYP